MALDSNDNDSSQQETRRRFHYSKPVWIDRQQALDTIFLKSLPKEFGDKLNVIDLRILYHHINKSTYKIVEGVSRQILVFDAAEARWTSRESLAEMFGSTYNGITSAERRLKKRGLIRTGNINICLKNVRLISFSESFMAWLKTGADIPNIKKPNDFPSGATATLVENIEENENDHKKINDFPSGAPAPDHLVPQHQTIRCPSTYKNKPRENKPSENEACLQPANPTDSISPPEDEGKQAAAPPPVVVDYDVLDAFMAAEMAAEASAGTTEADLDQLLGATLDQIKIVFPTQEPNIADWRTAIHLATKNKGWSFGETQNELGGFGAMAMKYRTLYHRNHMKPTDFIKWLKDLGEYKPEKQNNKPRLKLVSQHDTDEYYKDPPPDLSM